MLTITSSSIKPTIQYRISPKSVNEVLKTIELNTKKKHSKSFFVSLRNRKLSIQNATKTA